MGAGTVDFSKDFAEDSLFNSFTSKFWRHGAGCWEKLRVCIWIYMEDIFGSFVEVILLQQYAEYIREEMD